MDIITGKRWWSHGPTNKDPDRNGPAVVYIFRQRRNASGATTLEPRLVDDSSGVGTQVIVEGLIAHGEDADDHNLPLMIWYAAEPLITVDPARAVKLAGQVRIPQVRAFFARREATLMTEPDSHRTPRAEVARTALFEAFDRTRDAAWRSDILDGMMAAYDGAVKAVAPAGWNEVHRIAMATSALAAKAEQLAVRFGDEAVIAEKVGVLDRSGATTAERMSALAALRKSFKPELASVFQRALRDPALRGEALQGLGNFDDLRIPAVILAIWPELDAAEKRLALNVLGSRVSYARELLDAARAGRVPQRDLNPAYLRQLRQMKDPGVTRAVAALTGVARDSPASIARELRSGKGSLRRPGLPRASLHAVACSLSKAADRAIGSSAKAGKLGRRSRARTGLTSIIFSKASAIRMP